MAKEKTASVEKQKIRGTLDLIDGGWKLFIGNWKRFMVLGVLSFIVTLGVVYGVGAKDGVMAYLKTGEFQTMSLEDQQDYESMTDEEFQAAIEKEFSEDSYAGYDSTAVDFVFPTALLLLILVSFAFDKSIYDQGEGMTELGYKDLGTYTLKNILPYFLVTIMVGLIVIGGLILLIIPGIIFALWFSMVAPVFIIEDKRGSSVLKRSKELTRGYLMPIFGRVLLVAMVVAVASALLGYIPYTHILINLVATPVMLGAIYYVYKDLVEIKKA